MPLHPSPSVKTPPLLAELNGLRLPLFDETRDRSRRAELLGRIGEYLLVSLIVLVIAGIEVGRWYFKTPAQPVWVCAFAAALIAYAAVRIFWMIPQLRILAREREARRLLRLAIERLCARGYVLFEGVTSPRGWSLGLLLAGPNGVFCLIPRFVPRGRNLMETVEHVDRSTLRIGKNEVLADPLDQARRAAASLYDLLAAAGLVTVPVQPIVVFPGWTIQRPASFKDPDVLVTGEHDLENTVREAGSPIEPKDLIAVSLVLENLAGQPASPSHRGSGVS